VRKYPRQASFPCESLLAPPPVFLILCFLEFGRTFQIPSKLDRRYRCTNPINRAIIYTLKAAKTAIGAWRSDKAKAQYVLAAGLDLAPGEKVELAYQTRHGRQGH
jgi:hypothetical protein